MLNNLMSGNADSVKIKKSTEQFLLFFFIVIRI